MREDGTTPSQDTLRTLLEVEGIKRVAIVDDAFDSMAQRGLTTIEANDLWEKVEFEDKIHEELDRLDMRVDSVEDLAGELIDDLLEKQSRVPRFMDLWSKSIAGIRRSEAIKPLNALKGHLENPLELDVQSFGTETEPSALVAFDPQLIFLDWHLGDDGADTIVETQGEEKIHPTVQAAINQAKAVLEDWPKEKPKPLIILMSSRPGVEADAGIFCREAEILRGMFYAVPKSKLIDDFNLRLYLRLFVMSVPAGRRLQTFMDTLRHEFESARKRFLEAISDLTLTDYAYIQRLCLQNEGQPLGDYLIWLFSTYMGQLLFAEALKDVRSDLDSMTFEQALPSMGPPSDTLTDIYYKALFDTSVGSVESHPLADTDGEVPLHTHPSIALGDVLRYQEPAADVENEIANNPEVYTYEDEVPKSPYVPDVEFDASNNEEETAGESAKAGEDNPDLLLVINAQCDLEFRPTPVDTPESVKSLSILLMPGTLRPLSKRSVGRSKPKTELYQQDGEKYRIEWDTKKVKTVPFVQFRRWMLHYGYERAGRLRLPYALEIQRIFAADLTRIGSPVSPPIYQPISAQVLCPNSKGNTYETAESLSPNPPKGVASV